MGVGHSYEVWRVCLGMGCGDKVWLRGVKMRLMVGMLMGLSMRLSLRCGWERG